MTRAVRMVVLPIRIRRTARRLISGRMRTRRDAMMIIMRVMRLRMRMRMRRMPSRRCRIGGIGRRSTRLVVRRMPRRLELLLETGGVDLLMVVMGVMVMLHHARIGRMGLVVRRISVHGIMLQIFERIFFPFVKLRLYIGTSNYWRLFEKMFAPKNLVTVDL